MSENGEKQSLLGKKVPVANGYGGSKTIDITGLMVDSLSSSTSLRYKDAVETLASGPAFDESMHPEDLDDTWAVVSSKNAMKRKEHATSDLETLIHLLKGNMGPGLFSLPYAIMNAGLIIGPLGLLLVGIITAHCMVLLVNSARTLCKRNNINSLDYSETFEFAILRYNLRRSAQVAKWVVNVFLLITQFGFCCVYFVFIAGSLKKVAFEAFNIDLGPKVWIAVVVIPIVLVSWIKNLKHLGPISLLANLSLFVGLVIVVYDMIFNLATKVKLSTEFLGPKNCDETDIPVMNVAMYLGTTFYAFEGIGCILPIENKMKQPSHAPRIIIVGMCIVVSVFVGFSFLGFLAFGYDLQPSITYNLCSQNGDAQTIAFSIANILFAYMAYASYPIQFYVPMDFLEPIVFKKIREFPYRFPHRPKAVKRTRLLIRLAFRTVLVILTAVLAAAIPFLSDLITLVGALASTMLAFCIPALIDLFTFWERRKQRWLYIFPGCFWVGKNVAIITLGVFGCVFGTVAALKGIVDSLENPEPSSIMCPSKIIT